MRIKKRKLKRTRVSDRWPSASNTALGGNNSWWQRWTRVGGRLGETVNSKVAGSRPVQPAIPQNKGGSERAALAAPAVFCPRLCRAPDTPRRPRRFRFPTNPPPWEYYGSCPRGYATCLLSQREDGT